MKMGREATEGMTAKETWPLAFPHTPQQQRHWALWIHIYFNVIIMKKFLLPLMSLVFFATSTNAQNLNRNAVKAEVPAQMSLALAQPAQKGGVKKLADNQGLIAFTGSDGANGIGRAGFPTWSSASMVISDLDISDVANDLKGCKVVGLRFAVTGSLGKNAGVLALIFKGKNDQNGTELGADLADYDVTVISDNQQSVDVAWNEVSFNQPYEITGEETEVMYGYAYTQVKSQTNKNATPVLFGVNKDSKDYDDMFLVYGKPNAGDSEGLYYVSSEEKPYVPCFQLIVEKPGGSTSVIGIKGSEKAVASKYYTIGGAQLNAPHKGLNIVKMSDGRTVKVMK